MATTASRRREAALLTLLQGLGQLGHLLPDQVRYPGEIRMLFAVVTDQRTDTFDVRLHGVAGAVVRLQVGGLTRDDESPLSGFGIERRRQKLLERDFDFLTVGDGVSGRIQVSQVELADHERSDEGQRGWRQTPTGAMASAHAHPARSVAAAQISCCVRCLDYSGSATAAVPSGRRRAMEAQDASVTRRATA